MVHDSHSTGLAERDRCLHDAGIVTSFAGRSGPSREGQKVDDVAELNQSDKLSIGHRITALVMRTCQSACVCVCVCVCMFVGGLLDCLS